MTGKEKRELKDGVISIFKRFNILDHTATIGGLRDDILKYIDSLQEEPVSEDLGEYINDLSKQFPEVSFAKLSRIAVRVAKWQKEQMLAKAFDFTKVHNTACVLASECLRNHGWFNRERDFNDLFRHLSCVDKLFEGKFSGKTKVIVIKED